MVAPSVDKRVRQVLLFTALVLCFAGGARAQSTEYVTGNGRQAHSEQQSVITTSGADWAKDEQSYYVGILVALNGDFSRDGFIFRLNGNLGGYDYDTDSVAGGRVDVDERSFDVMLGYQKTVGDITGTGYIGFDYQDYDLSPNDPENQVRGTKTGFKVAVEIATGDETPVFVSVDSSYSTAFDSFLADLRVGYNMKWLIVGAEGAYYNVESDDTERLGGFATFRFNFSPTTPAELTLNAGHQFVGESGNAGGGNTSGGEGAYGGTSLSFSF